jgi:hypothetical protein
MRQKARRRLERRCSPCLSDTDLTLTIAALRGYGVLPEILGRSKMVSEDAVRRALKAIDEGEGTAYADISIIA